MTELKFFKMLTPHEKMKFFIKDFFSKCDQIRTLKAFQLISIKLESIYRERTVSCSIYGYKFQVINRSI